MGGREKKKKLVEAERPRKSKGKKWWVPGKGSRKNVVDKIRKVEREIERCCA